MGEQVIHINAEPGLIVLIPSWIRHYEWRNGKNSQQPRISVTFRAKITFAPGSGPVRVHFAQGETSKAIDGSERSRPDEL